MQLISRKRRKWLAVHFLMLVGFVLLQSAVVYGQSPTHGKLITYTCKEASLSDALRQIERLSGYYRLQFTYEDVAEYRTTLSLKDAGMEEALGQALRGTPLKYSADGRFIQIFRPQNPDGKRGNGVSGTVTDEEGEPLAGATVRRQGGKEGTITDLNGYFNLPLSVAHAVVEVSFIGKKTLTREVSRGESVRLMLTDDSRMMDEVVVTGIQTIEKGRATGAYALIDASDMKNIYSTDVFDKLEGTVPGLYVDGDKNLTIRGLSTLNANRRPLIVVDGFPLESSELNLNPNDIEQVTVLKDAASASIWGIRAANGVIVITTKRGAKQSKLEVSYAGNLTSTAKVDWDDLHILSSDEYVKVAFENVMTQGISGSAYAGLNELEKIYRQYDEGDITLDRAWEQVGELGQFNNARQITDNFYRRAFTQQHNLSLSAGGERVSTYVSLSYDQDKAREVGNESDKFNLLVNNDFRLHRTFSAQLGLRGTYRHSLDNGTDMTAYEPWKRILNDDGSYYQEQNGVDETWQAECEALGMKDWHKNVLEEMRMNDKRSEAYNLSSSLKLVWTPLAGLELSAQGNYEFGNTESTKFYSEDHFYTRNLVNQFTEVALGDDGRPSAIVAHHLPRSGGIKDLSNTHFTSYSVRSMASYSGSFRDWEYKVLAGNEVYSLEGNSYSNRLWGFDPERLTSQSINLAEVQGGVIGYNGYKNTLHEDVDHYGETLERYVSYFGTANVNYLGRYDLFGSVRLDQTNLLTNASRFRNNPSWSVGGKWDLDKEKFFQAPWVDALSLRLSYGLTGNIDKSTSPDLVARADSDFDIPSLNYLTITNPANPDLGWEKTYSWNAGVDYVLWGGLLSGSIDFYHKLSKGLLADIDIDPTGGWTSILKNSATVRNVGVDFALTARILRRTQLQWDATLNLSLNRNKVTDISYTPSRRGAYRRNPLKGHPIGTYAVHRYGGLDEEGEPTFMKPGSDTRYPYTELNTLTLDDLVYVGSSNPPVFGSLSSEWRYKDFTLDVLLTCRFGSKLRLPAPKPSMFGLYTEWLGEKYRWVEGADNTGKWVPKLYTASPYAPLNRDECLLYSDRMVDDGDVIYFRSVTLRYDATRLLRHIGLRGGSLSLGGENLGFWAANRYHLDPDALTSATTLYEISPGLGTRPRLVVGINIDF